MSSKGTKIKIILNLLLLIAIFAIIYYLINQSFADIFAELMSTSVVVLAATVILGTVYQIAEGRSIKEIAEPFAPNFTTKDGFLTSSYIAFLPNRFVWYRNIDLGNLFL